MAIEIVDFPMKNMVDLSIVMVIRLPEGKGILGNHSETIHWFSWFETIHLFTRTCLTIPNTLGNRMDVADWIWWNIDGKIHSNGEILQLFCRFWCASCGHVFVQAKWRTACVKFLQWRFWQGEGWKSIDEAHSMTWAGSWPSTPCYAGHRPLVSHIWHVHAT